MRSPIALLALLLPALALASQDDGAPSAYPNPPPGSPEPVAVADADAATEAEMKRYEERIVGADVTFTMVPIRGGTFLMGSPEDEPRRKDDEGPRHQVAVSPFWMGRCEVTWDEYAVFMDRLDISARAADPSLASPQDAWADAVSRPTPPYVPMDFEMGVEGRPAICMTQLAARQYTKWLSMKTGRFYRLPTEAEWEYACRAGTTTAYSFGDDPDALDDYAWFFDNADDTYHPVGTKLANPWGLHDMHGNVAEWVLDAYGADGYVRTTEDLLRDPVVWPTEVYPRVVRGGSWDDDPDRLRSAARRRSSGSWKVQDPQLPKSIWYHTDARWVGFRVVRPLVPPDEETRRRAWEPDVDAVRDILERQRRGER